MKYKIEKNTVQETLIIPLYARKVCSELYPALYRDETSIRLLKEIDYDFSEAEQKSRSLMQRFGALEVAMRQNDLAVEVRAYLKAHPNASVVNLGCGLDNTGRTCDNGSCRLYNLDFPDVITMRNELLPAGEREENIPCDLNDTAAWLGRIDLAQGAVFFASGVFYYFLKEQVRALVLALADACPEGALVFDAANQTAVRMIAKTWLKVQKSGMLEPILRFRMHRRSFPRGTAACVFPAGAICWLQQSKRSIRQRVLPPSRQSG